MSDYDLNELLATFMAEAEDDITALEAALLALEQTPDNAELRPELLRHAHTIKGNASCVGLQAVTAFAHAYEEKLEDFSAQLDVPLLLTGIDAFRRLIVSDTLTAEDQALIAALQHDGASPAPTPAPAQAPAPAEAPAEARVQVPARAHVRVAASKLNRMLDLSGEIAIARGRVRQLLAVRPVDAEALAEVESQVDQLQGQLQEAIMRARMVPVGPTFRQYERTVRDVAAAHGKNARLLTLGDEVELDTSAVELLRDPLTHMIRNAIDHGLETSAARVAAGKSPVGHITLEAHHEAGSVIIRVSDDGAGLDREAIAARAGLAIENETDLDRFIFEPGFTTAEEVTDLSGRGVGMDVVRRTIESLRGTITVASTKGEGTAFTIRLPLTLAVIDGFGVRAGDETYLVPLDHVVECVELPEASRGDDATGVLLLRDEVVPFVRLRHHFHAGGAAPARENILIVQVHGAKGLAKAGLAVDELHGASQAVIKPLGGYFNGVPGVSGSSILGNGRVALILDTPAILRSLEGTAAR